MMLLSRFWYVVLSLLLGGALVSLYIAQSMFNRAGSKVLAEGLSSDSQVVSWYVRNASRERSGQLITFALNPKLTRALSESSANEQTVPKTAREAANAEVEKLSAKVPEEFAFDAVFAIDQHGRVVGQKGYEQSTGNSNFELGGYPIVADALHGYIRDDAFAWDRLYLAVARPVESVSGAAPVGAILGLRRVDDKFAREISERTGAAVAFYSEGERIAAGTPEGFNRAQLDGIVPDLKLLVEQDKDYVERGRSALRYLAPTVGAVYAKLPGESWARGAGYVVGREAKLVASPFSFFAMADDKDKSSPDILIVGLVLLLGVGLGVGFTVLEHSRPLGRFAALATELASGKVDQLQVSRVHGVYRKIASLINDGVDHAVANGGGSRRVANLDKVLGDSGDQPAMSAFSFPDPTSPRNIRPDAPAPALPKPPPGRPPVPRRAGPPLAATMPEAGSVDGSGDLDAEWREVFEQFVALKRQCGESTDALTFEKFQVTLRKNREAIIQRHHVQRVKFSVYVKSGKAALKANPIRDKI